MFIRVDSTYINLDQIAQVERLENSGRGWNTRLTFKDGTERDANDVANSLRCVARRPHKLADAQILRSEAIELSGYRQACDLAR
jgi:hypothetical protein